MTERVPSSTQDKVIPSWIQKAQSKMRRRELKVMRQYSCSRTEARRMIIENDENSMQTREENNGKRN